MLRSILSAVTLCAVLSLSSTPRGVDACQSFRVSSSYSPYCDFSIFSEYPTFFTVCWSYYEFWDADIPSTCTFRAEAWCNRNKVCTDPPDFKMTDAGDPGFMMISLVCECPESLGIEGEIRAWHKAKQYQTCPCNSSCANFEFREITLCD